MAAMATNQFSEADLAACQRFPRVWSKRCAGETAGSERAAGPDQVRAREMRKTRAFIWLSRRLRFWAPSSITLAPLSQ